MFSKKSSPSEIDNRSEKDLIRQIEAAQEERYGAMSFFANATDAYGVDQAVFAMASADKKYQRLLLEARQKGICQYVPQYLVPWSQRWLRQKAEVWTFKKKT